MGADHEVQVFPDLPERPAARARRADRAVPRPRRAPARARVASAPSSSRSATTSPTTTSARSTGARPTRLGRPMSNQYREDTERDVVCAVDAGRLMAAPLGERTRLDVALDAVAAIASVADEVGDRCGVVAFDGATPSCVRPARRAGRAVVARCSTSSRRPRQRLRARLRHAGARQAGARHRLHRPARRRGRPPAPRGDARAHATSRGGRRERARRPHRHCRQRCAGRCGRRVRHGRGPRRARRARGGGGQPDPPWRDRGAGTRRLVAGAVRGRLPAAQVAARGSDGADRHRPPGAAP